MFLSKGRARAVCKKNYPVWLGDAVQTVQPKWSHQSHQTGKQYSQSIKRFSNRVPSAYLCPALRTDGVYFCIYFVFWLFWLLGPFPNGAVHELNEDDAHDQAGDNLDPGVKGKHLDPHWAESEGLGRRIFFNFRGSSESQICFWHRLWDSWTQEDAQKHLFFDISMFLRSQMSKHSTELLLKGFTLTGQFERPALLQMASFRLLENQML